MAVAWYFATALAKQWDAAFPYLSSGRFDATLLRMTLQKARESFRLSEWQKEQLKSIAVGRE
jgi:ABC-type amino acid transport substrate-binding protein